MSQAGRLANQMRLQAQLAGGLAGKLRVGLVSVYNPETYSAKVKIQPEDFETDYLPIAALQVGLEFGIYAAPAQGDQVLVAFIEGDHEAGVILGALFNDDDKPLGVHEGEIVIKHGSGASLTFDRTGVITMNAESGFNITGPVAITGTLDVSDKISAAADIEATGEVTGNGIALSTHTHPDAHGGNTGGPE